MESLNPLDTPAPKVCRWWWDDEGEDFLTSCRTVFGAQRKRCGNCGEAVKVVRKREDIDTPAQGAPLEGEGLDLEAIEADRKSIRDTLNLLEWGIDAELAALERLVAQAKGRAS